MSSTPTLPTNVKNGVVTIVPADTTSLKTILTTDGTFWRVTSISVCSDDTSNRTLSFYAGIGGTDYLIGSVTIPTLAGTDGAVAAVNVMGSTMWQAAIYDAFANRVLPLDTSVTLKAVA